MSTQRTKNIIACLTYFLVAFLPISTLAANNPFAGLAPSVTLNTPLYDSADCAAPGSGQSTPTPTSGGAAPSSPSPDSYISLGSIPKSGLQVGATTYGGGYDSGSKSWYTSNNQQGGRQPYDDNGMGNDGKPLPGRTAFAELNMGTALGGLPEHSKLAITYNGQTIIAEKDDIGGGGGPINGKPRDVDLWWETAKLLSFQNGSDVVTVHAVDPSTPVTPLSGNPSSGPTTGGASTSTCCPPSGSTAPTSGGPVSGATLTRFVQAEAMQENGGAVTGGSAGGAEGKYQYINSTWQASTAKFYPPASKYSDANSAPEEYQDAVAYINFGYFFQQEHGDMFRVAVDWFYPAANSNPSLLDVVPPANVITPRQYANQVIQKFNSNAGSKIPIKADQAPDFAKYAQQAGVPMPDTSGAGGAAGGASTCQPAGAAGAAANNITQTALNFAWPDTNDAAHATAGTVGNPGSEEPAYYKAWVKYDKASDTTDCSAYVATVMIASGVDPNYPVVSTPAQQYYVEHSSKYQIIKNPTASDLQPGDILIQNTEGIGHTEFYVGPQPGGYSDTTASLGGHTPDGSTNPNWMLSIKGVVVARYVGG